MTSDSSAPAAKGGFLLIGLFLLPFELVGIVVLAFGIQALVEGNFTDGWFLTLFGLVFSGFSTGMLYLLVRGRRDRARVDELRARAPSEPWRWREEWLTGEIPSSGKGTLVVLWVFAIFWNAISAPILILLYEEVFEKGNTAAALGLVFTMVGILLLMYAGRRTWAHLSYGTAVYAMEEVPGVIGGDVAGRLRVNASLQPENGFRARLSCIGQTRSGSGKNRSTHEDILWQEEQERLPAETAGGITGTTVNIRFLIPYEAEETTPVEQNSRRVLWRLDVEAEVPGVDFAATFEIPVFKTPRSVPGQTESQLRKESLRVTSPHFAPPANAGILVRPATEGGTEFVLLAGRNASGALGLGVFALVWTAALVFMIVAGAPIIFPVVFGFFELIILYGIVQYLFAETRVIVADGHISVRQYIFGLMFGKRIPCSDVARVKLVTGARAGSAVFYTLSLERREGKGVNTGGLIKSKQHAEWLAEEIEKAIASCRSHA